MLGSVLSFFSTFNLNSFNYVLKEDINKAKAYDVSRVEYAKVKEDCYLYKTTDITDNSFSNVYYIVPESYFVSVISEPNSMISEVMYGDKRGYVSSDTITKVDFTPVNPTLKNVTFDIKSGAGTQLWKVPDTDNRDNATDVIIPGGTKSVRYIASVLGTIPNNGDTNVWYYAVYSPATDPTSVYEGYIYSNRAENLTNIISNTEGNVEIVDPVIDENEDASYAIDSTVRLVLIILICVPIILVFVLLIFSNRKSKNKAQNALKSETEPEKPQNTKAVKVNNKTHFKKIDDFEGQTLKKKPIYFTKFMEQNYKTASLKPEFPSYEVVDDDDLL